MEQVKETHIVVTDEVNQSFDLWNDIDLSTIGLQALKLLDVFLTCLSFGYDEIDEDVEDISEVGITEVVFSKREYEKALGVSRVRTKQLQKHCEELSSLKFCNPNFADKKVFEYFKAYYDEQKGKYMIAAKCSVIVHNLAFSPKYSITYALKNTLCLKSKYSVLMYRFLRYALAGKSFVIFRLPYENLKNIMLCKDRYLEIRNFNEKVIKPVKAELKQKTNIDFIIYEYGRKEKNVTIVAKEK